MTFSLTAVQQAYLAEQMNKVSRSFALVAPAVEEPLKDYLAVAYLICRVVDNIEDCTMPFAWQQERFAEFATLLHNPAQAAEILTLWARRNLVWSVERRSTDDVHVRWSNAVADIRPNTSSACSVNRPLGLGDGQGHGAGHRPPPDRLLHHP